MAKYTAVLEQAADSTWSAYTLSPSLVAGVGETKQAALADLQSAMTLWLGFMRETGQPIPGNPRPSS